MNQSGEFHTHDGIHYHTHDHEDAHVHSGEGEHHHNHSHTHDPQQVRAIVNRLADVLIQLSAVKSEINNTGKLILKQHMEHCIVEAVRENDQTSIDKMNEAIDRFMK